MKISGPIMCVGIIYQLRPALIKKNRHLISSRNFTYSKCKEWLYLAVAFGFDTYSEEWLDFIMICRREYDITDYDLVIGGVANDKVFNTVELYFGHLIDKNETITRLRYEKPNLQICFRTQKAPDSCLWSIDS